MPDGPPIVAEKAARKRVPRWIVVTGGVVLLVATAILTANVWATPIVRRVLVRALEHNGEAEAHIDRLSVSLFPYPRAIGAGVVLRQKGRNGVLPLARARRSS